MFDRNVLNGYKLIEDASLIKQNGTQLVKRSFTERFLSWPWKPWQVAVEVPIMEPSDEFVVTDDSITAHPQLIQKLKLYHDIEDD